MGRLRWQSRRTRYLSNAFFRPFLWCVCLATLFCDKWSNGLGPSVADSPAASRTAGNSTATWDTKATTNATFSIEFKEGDHFPTVRFPLGAIGAILFPALITAYLFLLLTIVCDCFLVPCIQGISSRLEWSPDISAVTFMAAASSSPEMFVNILATFLTKSDVGVGTVLGTGLFAMLLVPAFCILFSSSKVLKVDFWPILRETFAYMISIIALVIVLADKKVEWYEAATLILIYLTYLIVLYFNDELKFKLEAFMAAIHKEEASGSLIEPISPLLPKPGRLPVSMSIEDVFYVLEDHTPESYTMRQWPSHRNILAKIEWILMWPIISVLRMTIPTFWNTRFHQLFIVTFIMCVAWIGLLCYCISWMITTLGNETSMPESVMGLTLLAAGMSIPETISGVIVAKQGYSTMALCNAYGSNIFAILICLAVPWLIKILFFEKSPGIDYIVINSEGMEYNSCIVLTAIIVVFLILMTNKLRLKQKAAWSLVLLYIIFIGISIYVELQFVRQKEKKI